MNNIHRSIWNKATGTCVAVSENVHSHDRRSPSGSASPAGGARFGLKAVAACVLLAFGPGAWALPVGGAVSAGSAGIATTAGTTTINQSSQNAAINWQSFSIGAGEAVRFVQPGSSSVALNRVLGPDPSSILGSLSANGRVFLVNPNGILFGAGAQVNVGALVASTLNINDADFMAGNYKFSGTGTGNVLNQGTLNADGGFVALLGANVSNQGLISARLGTVVLAAGSAMTLDMAGDGLLNVAVNQGAVNALVQNGGMIRADGGQVLLSAQSAGNLLSAVNNTGVIQAQTIGTHEGVIRLMGDMATGTVSVGGTLDASAPNGGNGGFIETSAAHVNIASDVRVSTAAPLGQTGTWLIDPVDFVVGSAPGNNITGAALSAQVQDSNVTIATVAGPGVGNGDIIINEAVVWNGNIGLSAVATTLTLNALRDVTINAPITATHGNLVACCGRDVNVNAHITTTTGSVLLSGRDVNVVRNLANPLSEITVTDGNLELCATRDVNLNNALNPGLAPLMTETRSSAIPAESLASLGVPLGMTLNSGGGGTGPGVASGTVNFVNGGLAGTFVTLTGPGAPVTIRYNPTSYLTPTDYSLDFTGTGGPVTSLMLVYPGGANKTFDGTTTAVFTSLQGSPTGVTLVAGPGSTANFDTATAGVGKTITYSGFTLAGANVAAFSLPVACCASPLTQVLGNIIPPVVVPPPDVIPVAIVTPVALLVADDTLPIIQNILGSEYPRQVPALNLSVVPFSPPPIQLAVAPEVVPVVVPVVLPPPPPPPQIYVPPVRPVKPYRN